MPRDDVSLDEFLRYEAEQAYRCTICSKQPNSLTTMYYGLRTVRACPACRVKLTGVRDERKRK